MKPEAFHPFARLLHWLMAVLILAMLFIGVSMVADLSLRHPVLIGLHKATGLALLVLVVLRIGVRLAVPHPPLPRDLPTLQRWAAGASHLLLYGLMLAMPLLGWAMLSAGDYPRPLGLPPIAPHNLQLYAVLPPGTRLGRLPVVRHGAGARGCSLDARVGAPRRRVA